MAPHEARPIALVALVSALAALLHCASLYAPSTWIQRDGRSYVNVNQTITEGTLEQPFARSWYDERLGWNTNLDAGWSNVAMICRSESSLLIGTL